MSLDNVHMYTSAINCLSVCLSFIVSIFKVDWLLSFVNICVLALNRDVRRHFNRHFRPVFMHARSSHQC